MEHVSILGQSHLPIETIAEITRYLPASTLCVLAHTSRTLQSEAERSLYRTVLRLDTDAERFMAFLRVVGSSKRRALLVRKLRIPGKVPTSWSRAGKRRNNFFTRRNLKRLLSRALRMTCNLLELLIGKCIVPSPFNGDRYIDGSIFKGCNFQLKVFGWGFAALQSSVGVPFLVGQHALEVMVGDPWNGPGGCPPPVDLPHVHTVMTTSIHCLQTIVPSNLIRLSVSPIGYFSPGPLHPQLLAKVLEVSGCLKPFHRTLRHLEMSSCGNEMSLLVCLVNYAAGGNRFSNLLL